MFAPEQRIGPRFALAILGGILLGLPAGGASAQNASIAEMKAVMSAARAANLRAQPSADSALVGHLDAGQEVTVTGRTASGPAWYRLALPDGRTAYIAGSLLLAAPDKLPAPPPAATAGKSATQRLADASQAYMRRDYATALKLWRPLAEAGVGEAQDGLASLYADGHGIAQDDAEAIRWLRLAALERNNAAAQNALGFMLSEGRGAERNDAEAAKWWREAADHGNAAAQRNLGLAYVDGRGVPMSDNEAVRWFKRAAEQGYAAAQGDLGYMYSQGRGGLDKDLVKAAQWYRRSAEQGDLDAQCNLAKAYAGGFGLRQNFTEAAKWFTVAAERGNGEAQGFLGAMYSRGIGVAQDRVAGHMWLTLALARTAGDIRDASLARLKDVSHEMTGAQIDQAIRKAEAWKPKGE